jgi:RecA-family ATPase
MYLDDLDILNLKDGIKKAMFVDIDAPFDEEYEPWVLEPLIPREAITILDGLGGSGKSWFALDIAYSIGLGQPFLGIFPVKQSGTVLYLTAEEVPQMFYQRLKTIRKHYPRNENFHWISFLHKDIQLKPYLCMKQRGTLVETETREVLDFLLAELQPVLVVLDSLINFYGLDENSSEDAMFFYDTIKTLAKTYGTSFLLLHHQNKEGMKTQADDTISFRGSGVLREQARSRIVYKNIKITEKTIARKIKLEKSNYYSRLKDELLPNGSLYLKFENGVHKYDKAFELTAKKAEEEAKNKKKGKNKKQEEIEDYDIPF